jgi:hypothetical protein
MWQGPDPIQTCPSGFMLGDRSGRFADCRGEPSRRPAQDQNVAHGIHARRICITRQNRGISVYPIDLKRIPAYRWRCVLQVLGSEAAPFAV